MKKFNLFFLILALLSSFAYADDIEVYIGDPNASGVKPNVIFIFDTSGSMSGNVTYCEEYGTKTTQVCKKYEEYNCHWFWGCDTRCAEYEEVVEEGICLKNTTKTRLQITKDAAKKTIKNLSNVNLAVMRYNPKRKNDSNDASYRGGYLLTKMLDVDNSENRSTILDVIDNKLPADGGTPMTESVHEAYNFFTGSAVDYGKSGSTYYGETGDKNVSENGTYISPITQTCQKNHIVLFTDGDSSVDGESNSQIRSWIGEFTDRPSGLSASCTSNAGGNKALTESCLEELAYFMNNRDAAPWLEGEQAVQFHAIGGFVGGVTQKILNDAAGFGGGVSANAQNPSELEAALTKVFDNIVQSGGTFAAPAVAVNAFNSLEHLDQMYYSLFKPHEAVGWAGNVKRYRMQGTEIVDVDGKPAIDPSTGFFKEGVKSFWSPNADGDNITAGGMASQLQDVRVVVTNLTGNNLMNETNRVRGSNSLITRRLMGTTLKDASFEGSDIDPDVDDASDTNTIDPYETKEFTKLVNWVGGFKANDTATESRRSMEDPLHSTPVLVNYGSLTIDGKKVPDSTLFVGTNSGYLHAFDTNKESPQERFAFIPRELLPVATKYYEGVGKKKYGLDGHITVWHNDTNKNMLVDNGEQAILYIGMRRGGSSYYALDISDRRAPKLLWQINGKGHQDGATAGFEELGQTWSKMILIDIQWQGAKKKALVFAGGYDIKEDNNSTRKEHSVGNAIFIVDAATGNLLWKASKATGNLKLANMTSAITGNVVPIDDNSDGYVDLFYVADLGGRIWRFDVDQSVAKDAAGSASSYMTGGMIADLGKDGSKTENVRFYDSLDVVYTREFAYVEEMGNQQVLIQKPRYMLSIGSGYRAHPLDTSAKDYFYVLFDYNTEGPALDGNNKPVYTAKTKADLQSYSFSAVSGAESSLEPTVKSNNGFYFKLISAEAGEKVLSSSITVNNTIYFTSFRPSTGIPANSCVADTGNSRLYRISLRFRASSGDDEGDGNDPYNRGSTTTFDDIVVPGIAPTPIPKIVKKEDCSNGACDNGNTETVLIVGTKVIDDLDDPEFNLKKTYWKELSN